MNSLENILNNKRKNGLNQSELRQLIREIFSTNNVYDRSISHLVVIKGLEKRIINPDFLISIAISEILNSKDFILLTIALRYGANRNLYIRTPIGPCHIIVYTVYTLKNLNRDLELMKIIITILILMGSQVSSSAFDENGGEPKEEKREVDSDEYFLNKFRTNIPEIKPVKIKTVSEWLMDQGMLPFTDISEILKTKTSVQKINLGTICNRPDIFDNNSLSPNIDNIMMSKNYEILKYYTQEIDIKIPILGCSFEIFKYAFDKGIKITYFDINQILIAIKNFFKTENYIQVNELLEILKYTIINGKSMDLEQLAILSSTNLEITNQILKEYSAPKWKKICFQPNIGFVPDSLHTLTNNLNIGELTDKSKICTKLTQYYQADHETLKNSIINRQQKRIQANISTITDFISDSSTIKCANQLSGQSNPLEYSDASMSYYKDDDNKIWCFLSNSYKSLIETPINPYTSRPLPPKFREELQNQLNLLEKLGINPNDPKKIIETIDDLHKSDEITNTHSEMILSTILSLFEIENINRDKILNLNSQQIFDLIGINVNMLTKRHQLITFSRYVYSELKKDKNLINVYIDKIKFIN